MDLRQCLSQKELNIKDYELLTTAEGARALSYYKITIDPKDYERASTDASLWAYRVGVRLFKHFNSRFKQHITMNRSNKKTGFKKLSVSNPQEMDTDTTGKSGTNHSLRWT